MGIIKKVIVNCYQCKKELLRCIYRENAICFSCKQENKKKNYRIKTTHKN